MIKMNTSGIIETKRFGSGGWPAGAAWARRMSVERFIPGGGE
jgi:hypothetical protein